MSLKTRFKSQYNSNIFLQLILYHLQLIMLKANPRSITTITVIAITITVIAITITITIAITIIILIIITVAIIARVSNFIINILKN